MKFITIKIKGYYRATNHLGGFEGGMTNGMPLIINGVMKPIPTLYKPLNSVDINTKEDLKQPLNVQTVVLYLPQVWFVNMSLPLK